MSLSIATEANPLPQTEDGYYNFNCPRCGKTITRYHPKTKGALQLKCPRTGVIGQGNKEKCGWQDYVYFNCTSASLE